MRRFTKACHEAGVVIHGTFVLGLPVETQETIEETIRFAQELDVFSMQVSLAAPYPGTELYEPASERLVREEGGPGGGRRLPATTLSYPGLSKDEIFEAVDRFYRRYYLAAPDPAHHQDDAGGQGRVRAPLPRRLRVLQEHGQAPQRFGGDESEELMVYG